MSQLVCTMVCCRRLAELVQPQTQMFVDMFAFAGKLTRSVSFHVDLRLLNELTPEKVTSRF